MGAGEEVFVMGGSLPWRPAQSKERVMRSAIPGIKNGTRWCRLKRSSRVAVSGRSVGNPAGVLAEGTGCDVADVVTVQADVGRRVVRQVAEFVHRAAVGNPVLCDADRVHVLLLEMLAGRSVLPVCDACIRDTSVNVQCKENAAAMHLCNKT